MHKHFGNNIKFVLPLQQKIPEVQHLVENSPANVEGMAVAQRVVKIVQVYQSSTYSRKKKSASYLTQFSEEGLVYFRKAEFYLKNGKHGFAVINTFKNLQLNVTEINIPQPEDSVLKEFGHPNVSLAISLQCKGLKNTNMSIAPRCNIELFLFKVKNHMWVAMYQLF